jgi:hypothetical protein
MIEAGSKETASYMYCIPNYVNSGHLPSLINVLKGVEEKPSFRAKVPLWQQKKIVNEYGQRHYYTNAERSVPMLAVHSIVAG